MKASQILNNKELTQNGSIEKFKSAYGAFSQALQEASGMQDIGQRTSHIQ